jgi:hypothetical protein
MMGSVGNWEDMVVGRRLSVFGPSARQLNDRTKHTKAADFSGRSNAENRKPKTDD